MVDRKKHLLRIESLFRTHPVVALLGARQVGKTTLARVFSDQWDGPKTHFDLEDPDDLARLEEPKLTLGPLGGLIVLDEIQRRPNLFPVLRVLLDQPGWTTRILILGSASPELLRQGSETLAGRIAFHELDGFGLEEVGRTCADPLWFRGGFPRSFLADSDEDSWEWRSGFVRTFLERDIPQLGSQIPSATLQRFWRMLAHHHAQIWNSAEFARALGVSGATTRRYLDLLTGALVVRLLPPWHENLAKRQVKAPKVFLADTGLLHNLLGVRTPHDLEGHPKVGASWEGFVIKELIQHLGAQPEECFFWATHAGAELDLLVIRGESRRGFEIKRTTSPTTTRSMHEAREDLGLDVIQVIHGGDHSFPMKNGIQAVAFSRMAEDIAPLSPREF